MGSSGRVRHMRPLGRGCIRALFSVVIAFVFMSSTSAWAQTPPSSLSSAWSTITSFVGSMANTVNGANNGTCNSPPSWQSDANTFAAIASAITNPFNSADSVISSTALGIAGSMTTGAYALGGMLALSYFFWNTLRFLAASDDNFIKLALDSLIPASIGAAIVAEYSSIIGGFQSIFATMMSSVSGSGGLTAAISNFANSIFTAFGTALLSTAQGMSCSSILSSGAIAEFLHGILVILLLAIGFILAVIAFCDLIGVMLTGSVLVGVGISVGPYFIIAGITKWTKGFTDRWVGFVLSSMFYKTVITIVLALMTGVMTSVTAETRDYSSGTGGFPIGDALAMVGLMWVLKHVFMAIPSIASGLFGGASIGAPSAHAEGKALAKSMENREKEKERQEQRLEDRADRAALQSVLQDVVQRLDTMGGGEGGAAGGVGGGGGGGGGGGHMPGGGFGRPVFEALEDHSGGGSSPGGGWGSGSPGGGPGGGAGGGGPDNFDQGSQGHGGSGSGWGSTGYEVVGSSGDWDVMAPGAGYQQHDPGTMFGHRGAFDASDVHDVPNEAFRSSLAPDPPPTEFAG
jgi:hypothetical protein